MDDATLEAFLQGIGLNVDPLPHPAGASLDPDRP
jgi:hypothetical protein